MQRREFICQSLSLAGALPLTAGAISPGQGDPASRALLVLVDTRYAPSRRFGEAAAAQGARVSHYDGDLTRLWQDTLMPQWRSGRGAMAGIGTDRGWLCLMQLAGEHRWKASAQRLEGSHLMSWRLWPGVES